MTVTSSAQGVLAPQPFRIAVEEATLLDLKRRLDATRWPDEVSESGWAFGADLGYLRSVINYWRQDYDWRKYERMLNGFRQFTVPINDVDVHFIYEQGEGSASLPLLLTHGWPGSIVEFHELIPLLTHPSAHGGEAQDAFTVVAPSIPGYGFSFRPNQRRFCVSAWNKDPVFGVIGIQSGPRGLRVHTGFHDYGSRGWDADCGDDCEDPARFFCTGQVDQGDLS